MASSDLIQNWDKLVAKSRGVRSPSSIPDYSMVNATITLQIVRDVLGGSRYTAVTLLDESVKDGITEHVARGWRLTALGVDLLIGALGKKRMLINDRAMRAHLQKRGKSPAPIKHGSSVPKTTAKKPKKKGEKTTARKTAKSPVKSKEDALMNAFCGWDMVNAFFLRVIDALKSTYPNIKRVHPNETDKSLLVIYVDDKGKNSAIKVEMNDLMDAWNTFSIEWRDFQKRGESTTRVAELAASAVAVKLA